MQYVISIAQNLYSKCSINATRIKIVSPGTNLVEACMLDASVQLPRRIQTCQHGCTICANLIGRQSIETATLIFSANACREVMLAD